MLSMCVQARATPVTALAEGLSNSAAYAKGLWDRLNGGGRRGSASGAPQGLPSDLPAPVSTRGARSASIAQLSREIDALEQKLQEASKVGQRWLRGILAEPLLFHTRAATFCISRGALSKDISAELDIWIVVFAVQVRETKVRRAGIGGRARLAGELRDMDNEVCSVLKCFFLRVLLLHKPFT
jgi:hypothetical protein